MNAFYTIEDYGKSGSVLQNSVVENKTGNLNPDTQNVTNSFGKSSINSNSLLTSSMSELERLDWADFKVDINQRENFDQKRQFDQTVSSDQMSCDETDSTETQ